MLNASAHAVRPPADTAEIPPCTPSITSCTAQIIAPPNAVCQKSGNIGSIVGESRGNSLKPVLLEGRLARRFPPQQSAVFRLVDYALAEFRFGTVDVGAIALGVDERVHRVLRGRAGDELTVRVSHKAIWSAWRARPVAVVEYLDHGRPICARPNGCRACTGRPHRCGHREAPGGSCRYRSRRRCSARSQIAPAEDRRRPWLTTQRQS